MKEKYWIVTNDAKDVGCKVRDRVKRFLEEKEKSCSLCVKDSEHKICEEEIPEDISCAIVIGGDGSLIEVARVLKGRDVPILGINMGTLGYLTEVEVSNIEESLQQVLDGNYIVEKRMMLDGNFGGDRTDVALNDIVVARKDSVRMIRIKIYVNGEFLNSYEADGIIISTPTGSTAYNLAAGGPIVEPTASLIVITPICSHALNASSIVLSGDDDIVMEIGEGKYGTHDSAYVAFDGADTFAVESGDRVYIKKSHAETKILKLCRDSFLETLRRKMKGN